MFELIKVLKSIINHPLNKRKKLKAIFRFIKWQIVSRLNNKPIKKLFVNNTFLLVKKGMTGATGNIYNGLQEFQEMSFILHSLNENDVFIDVGSNIGSYTLLSSGVIGAKSISIEPVPSTYNSMLQNIEINNLESRVRPLNIGLSHKKGNLLFTSNEDAENHVISNKNIKHQSTNIDVQVDTLDSIAKHINPTIIKIDVEGYEWNVLQGGIKTFKNHHLLAVIIETNRNGKRYGFSDKMINKWMVDYGFTAFDYDPFKRSLKQYPINKWNFGNTIYCKDIASLKNRIKNAAYFNLSTGLII